MNGPASLGAWFDARAGTLGARPAVLEKRLGLWRTTGWAAHAAEVHAAAAALARAGVGPGDRVIVVGPAGGRRLALERGVLHRGATVVVAGAPGDVAGAGAAAVLDASLDLVPGAAAPGPLAAPDDCLALEFPGRAGCGPTHGEWLAAIGRLGRQAVPGGGGATQFGCMPPDWPAGQYFAHVAACCWGGTVAFAENAETIGTDLAAVQPAFLAGPPRLFERLAEALDEAMAGATGPQRWVVRAAVARRLGPVDGFVLARARRLLGLGRVATALCVGEAPPVPLVARFDGLGVRVASVAPGQLPGLAPVPRVAHFIETSLAAT